jgi:CubicO group peptidase (beta-lactamase class C family)
LRRAVALSGALLLAFGPLGSFCPFRAADAWAQADAPAASQQAAAIDAAIAAEIADGHLAGAVVVTGDADGARVRVARGARVTGEQAEPMTADTVFDLASLTKPVATAVAIMQLAERGMLGLDMPAAHYWPAFGTNEKAGITIRQLLAHVSGLPAGVSSARALRSRAAVLADIVAMAPVATPGTRVRYSDVNYVVLGEIVRRVSHRPLDAWCAEHVFGPLGMTSATFRPAAPLSARVAPTVVRDGRLLRGRVHDPVAAALGGVAGNAGLFASADDLARFARMLLNGGTLGATRVLSARSVAELETPLPADTPSELHTPGWAVGPPLVANRYRLPPVGALQHLGYTGTALWIDPVTRRFAIVLTSRLYPDETGTAMPLRALVVGIVSSAAAPVTPAQIAARVPPMADALAAAVRPPPSRGPVLAGIDVLAASGYAAVAGKRIALVTNRSGFDRFGRRTADLLAHAPGARLVALFAPEHGLGTDVDDTFGDSVDAATGAVVHSLYGERRTIAPALLADVDVLVVDLQDAGVRFFTYLATLGYALEAGAAAHRPVIVLDRPDPLGADAFGGPVADAGPSTFTRYYALPLAPGMTIGELARLFNDRLQIGATLSVVPLANYARTMRFDDTGSAGCRHRRTCAIRPRCRSIRRRGSWRARRSVSGAAPRHRSAWSARRGSTRAASRTICARCGSPRRSRRSASCRPRANIAAGSAKACASNGCRARRGPARSGWRSRWHCTAVIRRGSGSMRSARRSARARWPTCWKRGARSTTSKRSSLRKMPRSRPSGRRSCCIKRGSACGVGCSAGCATERRRRGRRTSRRRTLGAADPVGSSELLVVVQADMLDMRRAVSRNREVDVIDAFPACVEHVPVRDRIAVPRRFELHLLRLRVKRAGRCAGLHYGRDVRVFDALAGRPVEQRDGQQIQVHVRRRVGGAAARCGSRFAGTTPKLTAMSPDVTLRVRSFAAAGATCPTSNASHASSTTKGLDRIEVSSGIGLPHRPCTCGANGSVSMLTRNARAGLMQVKRHHAIGPARRSFRCASGRIASDAGSSSGFGRCRNV